MKNILDEKIELIRKSLALEYSDILNNTLIQLINKKNNLITKTKDSRLFYTDKKYTIYKLIQDNYVVYVGITSKNLRHRIACGYKWINKLEKGYTYEVIEYTDDFSREQHWILYYINNGNSLFNKNKIK